MNTRNLALSIIADNVELPIFYGIQAYNTFGILRVSHFVNKSYFVESLPDVITTQKELIDAIANLATAYEDHKLSRLDEVIEATFDAI
jgi:hypothetical protein